MEIVIATTLAFVLGVITGVMGLLTIASRNKKKIKSMVTGPVKTKTENIDWI